jgi:FkbM family methyltransferase
VSHATAAAVDRARHFYWRLHRDLMRLRWRWRPEESVVCASGNRLFLDTRDARAFALWLSRGDVNPPSLALWRLLLGLRPWSVVVDVGANHGEMLLNAALPAGARVFAFEPNPALTPFLRRSLAATALDATVIEAAVGDAEGEIALFVDPRWSGNSTAVAAKAAPGAAARRVPLVTLAGFLTQGDPPALPGALLLKIDVEGHEIAVLRGLLPGLALCTDLAIMTEVHRMEPAELDWLAAHFDLALMTPAGRLRRATPAEAAAQDGLDAVLFRKGEAARFGVA